MGDKTPMIASRSKPVKHFLHNGRIAPPLGNGFSTADSGLMAAGIVIAF
jgi:hypothetical protein